MSTIEVTVQTGYHHAATQAFFCLRLKKKKKGKSRCYLKRGRLGVLRANCACHSLTGTKPRLNDPNRESRHNGTIFTVGHAAFVSRARR